MLGRIAAGLLLAFGSLAVLVRVRGELPGDGALARLSLMGGPRALALTVDPLTGYPGTAVMTGFAEAVGRERRALPHRGPLGEVDGCPSTSARSLAGEHPSAH